MKEMLKENELKECKERRKDVGGEEPAGTGKGRDEKIYRKEEDKEGEGKLKELGKEGIKRYRKEEDKEVRGETEGTGKGRDEKI